MKAKAEPQAYEIFPSPLKEYFLTTIIIFKNATSRQYTPSPDLEFINSSSFADCNPLSMFPFRIKPDISIYSLTEDDNVTTNSASAEIFIEFK